MNINQLTNKEKIDIINKHQKDYRFHPLTCGDCGDKLKPIEYNNNIYLICNNDKNILCDYIQTYIPEIIYSYYECSKLPLSYYLGE